MATKQETNKPSQQDDFEIGFTGEDLAGIQAHTGESIKVIDPGHYTLKVVRAEPQPDKAQKHIMVRLTFEITAALDAKHKAWIGETLDGLYGGLKSPLFMRRRMKAVTDALGVVIKQGALKASQLVGRTLDACVINELSDSDKLDDFGNTKKFINNRVKGERKVGAAAPAGIDPVRESKAAADWLKKGSESTGEASEAAGAKPTASPWDSTEQTGGAEAAGDTSGAGGFTDESEVPDDAHLYRAHVKLGTDEAEQCRQMLVDAGFDPEGPINLETLRAQDEDVHAQYVAKFPPAKPGKKPLKPLNGAAKQAQQ